MEQEIEIDVMIADASHEVYVDTILDTIESAAKVRGTGIAKRTHEYVAQKMKEGKAVIALAGNEFAGFSYIESWGNKQYVTTSGLIVHPNFRGLGIAKRIKDMTFQLARMRWPKAKIFSLTSGAAVMKMNTELGYVPVTFSDLTDDEAFWRGCNGCVNHDILERTEWAENYLFSLGFTDFRVRLLENSARLQFPKEQLEQVLQHRKQIVQTLKTRYDHILLDLEVRHE